MTKLGAVSRALAQAVKDAQLSPRDAAGVALAKRYAAQIDADPESLADLGPKLLSALTALGLTPAGRGVKGVGSGQPVAGALDELRERRARKSAAAGSHAAAP